MAAKVMAYDDDYYAWTNAQAALLRQVQPEWLDWRNLAEEVDDLGRSEHDALESHLENLVIHLLKWRYQPGKRTASWEASIMNPRERIERLFKRSPSLRPRLPEALASAYSLARRRAGVQMKMDRRQWEAVLPAMCEWTLEQVLDPEFWPEAA
jgi:hypothetical protein